MVDWRDLERWHLDIPETGVALDIADMAPGTLEDLAPPLAGALQAMEALEAGGVANPDEGRRVGHYWLRDPERAPEPELREAIERTVDQVVERAREVRQDDGTDTILHLGIGGSALGPQLLVEALGGIGDTARGAISPRRYYVLDNTDPAAFHRVLEQVDLARCRVLVVSKSGGTPETRNALLRVRLAFQEQSIPFAPRALAITGEGSQLHRLSVDEGWWGRLPLWDWVGGRTSITGPVGLLPAALVGVDIQRFLAGAAAMDRATRTPWERNPAAWLAGAWFRAREDRPRSMVMLPYADRLAFLGRYLQQLVMESLGKRWDRSGAEVRAGLTVFGNKGSTDQHAYVQQLRDGPDDFFVNFVRILDPGTSDPALESGTTAGDALDGFLMGTRAALSQDGKRSLTLELDALDARTLGAVLALYERAVGIYAELLDINAYHQPGVEAGKKAAARFLDLQRVLSQVLSTEPHTAGELAALAEEQDEVAVWRILVRLAASTAGPAVLRERGPSPSQDRFRLRGIPA